MRTIESLDANGNPIVRNSTATEDTNTATIVTRANTALTNNGTYLGLATPTTAQNTAQVQALTRQVNGVIRLLLVGSLTTITDS